MKLIVALMLASFVAVAVAQGPFTSSVSVTVQRKSAASQNNADNALNRDIERFVKAYYPAVAGATLKDDQGVCQPFSIVVPKAGGTTKTVNLEIYNRDANCFPALLQSGKTDLKSQSALGNVYGRIVNIEFDTVTDGQYVKEARTSAEAQAATDNATRAGEKP